MENSVKENLVGVELRKTYPGYNSNFGNRSYEIKHKGAKDNQLECLKKFGPAKIRGQHPETLEWMVGFEGELDKLCFFGTEEAAIAFKVFHNSPAMEYQVIRHPHYKSRWTIKSRRHPRQIEPDKWLWFMGGRPYPTKKSAICSFKFCYQDINNFIEIN